MIQRRLGLLDQLMIQRLVQAVILRDQTAPPDAAGHLWIIENGRKIEPARLPVIQRPAHFDAVHAADHLVHVPKAKLRHPLPHFFGDEEEKVDDVFGRAAEFGAQRRVLRGDADRAGVQMALAHHDAAHRYQRRSRKSEFFRS